VGPSTASPTVRDFRRPPVHGLVVPTTGHGAWHGGVTCRAHVMEMGLGLLVYASIRASQLQAAIMTADWSSSLSLSLTRHLGGWRECLGLSRVLQARVTGVEVTDVFSGATSINMYRWSDRVSTFMAILQSNSRRKASGVTQVMSTTDDPLHATQMFA
jgi:hypothetical protein